MKYSRPLILLAVVSFTLLTTACHKKSAVTSKVVATINGQPITQKEFDSYMQLNRVPQPATDQSKKLVMDQLINLTLLSQDAVKHGLEKQPDVRFLIKQQRENILANAMVRQYLTENPVSDADVKARYNEELAKTNKYEYRARHILVKSKAEAQRIITELQHGANFAALAKKDSIDLQSARLGGELGWFNQTSMVPAFFDAVATMKKGEISPQPVKTQFGYHVIQLEDVRPFKFPAYDEIEDRIRTLVQQERVKKMLDQLKAKAKIKIAS
ncbi:MAG: peptidylprolyl isomerase [Acidiferrobacterales bacterium]